MMKKKSSNIRIVHLPDLHIGHPKIEAEQIYEHITKYIYPHLNEDVDILNIGGDFFHQLLNMNSMYGIIAATVIQDFVNLARANKFYIRVVRGTFSHDRYQNRFFNIPVEHDNKLNNNSLVKVYDNLDIEHFDDLNINVLYCPDDQPYDNLTESVINKIESVYGRKVDFIFSHGYYTHLLPFSLDHIPHNTIDSKIVKYVKGCILNGHIHKASVYNNIVSGGSFERMNHGESEDKGFYIVDYDKENGKCYYKFIVNKDSIPFETFKLSDYETIDDFYDAIKVCIQDYKELDDDKRLYIRLDGAPPDIIELIHQNFKNVYVTTKSSNYNLNNEETSFEDIYCDLPEITEDNLPTFIYNGIKAIASDEIALSIEEIIDILQSVRKRK